MALLGPPRLMGKGLLLLLALAVLGLALSSSSIFDAFNQQWIDTHIRNSGLRGVMYFVLIGTLATLVGCPRQLVAFLGGYAFGFADGSLLSTLSVGASCLISLLIARIAIRPLVTRLFPRRIVRVNKFLTLRPIVKTIIIRLLPIGNNLITNLIAGVTSVKAHYFVLGSLIGYFPQMAIFALMGSGVMFLSVWQMLLSVLLFAASSALSVWLYKEHQGLRPLDPGIDLDIDLPSPAIHQTHFDK